jgi:yecA family protein
MRHRLAEIWEGFSGFPSSAFVEGLLAALLIARREVPEHEWVPLVMGDQPLQDDEVNTLKELVTFAWRELNEAMMQDPGSCVPPAKSKSRCEWCRGFVAGMKLSEEPPRDNEIAMSIVISMDVLGGGYAFEELALEAPQSEKRWRREVEQSLPDMVLTLVTEISKEAGAR